MGETSNFYEKCSSLSKKGDEKSLRTLLQMGISGNKTARVALRKTRNKKLLKTLIDEYLDNIPSEYNAGMILNLAVKVLRKEYLYVYLMEIFHEKKDLKEIGFFKSVKDIPLDKQEQIEVKKYIIDTKDFDIRLISLIAVEEREDILYALLTSNNGKIELVVGALQTYGSSRKNTKIDRNSVIALNNFRNEYPLTLYTYQNSFYHICESKG